MPSETPGRNPPANDARDERLMRARLELATANRSIAVGLDGTCVALLTFALFFLFPQFADGRVDGLLFQATLATIVVSLFLFGYSAVYYYRVLGAAAGGRPERTRYVLQADLLFFIGILAITLEPTLILYTIRLYTVAILALVMWVVFIALAVMGRRDWE